MAIEDLWYKNAVITLQVRRGESVAFVTVSGLADKG